MFTPRLLVDNGGVWQAGSTDGGSLANARTQIVRANSFHISDSHTFTSNLINVASMGYNRYWNGSVPSTSGDYPPTLGFGETGAGNFPKISFNGGVNGITESSIGNSWGGRWIAEAYILNDTVTWVHGHHTFKFGGEAWHQNDSATPYMGASPSTSLTTRLARLPTQRSPKTWASPSQASCLVLCRAAA